MSRPQVSVVEQQRPLWLHPRLHWQTEPGLLYLPANALAPRATPGLSCLHALGSLCYVPALLPGRLNGRTLHCLLHATRCRAERPLSATAHHCHEAASGGLASRRVPCHLSLPAPDASSPAPQRRAAAHGADASLSLRGGEQLELLYLSDNPKLSGAPPASLAALKQLQVGPPRGFPFGASCQGPLPSVSEHTSCLHALLHFVSCLIPLLRAGRTHDTAARCANSMTRCVNAAGSTSRGDQLDRTVASGDDLFARDEDTGSPRHPPPRLHVLGMLRGVAPGRARRTCPVARRGGGCTRHGPSPGTSQCGRAAGRGLDPSDVRRWRSACQDRAVRRVVRRV